MKWKLSFSEKEYRQLILENCQLENHIVNLEKGVYKVILIYGIIEMDEEGKKLRKAMFYWRKYPERFAKHFFKLIKDKDKHKALKITNSLKVGFHYEKVWGENPKTGFYKDDLLCFSTSNEGNIKYHYPSIFNDVFLGDDMLLWFIITQISQIKDYFNRDVFGRPKLGPFKGPKKINLDSSIITNIFA